ncbi:MAG: tetratricopeptide repeat protein [Tepidisphaeraceae bacterium]
MSSIMNTSDVITFSMQARREGQKQYEAGNLDAAAGAFRNATNQNPRDYVSFYYLGEIYRQQGREQMASQAYQTSLRVQPETNTGKADLEQRTRTAQAFANFLATASSRETELDGFIANVQKRNTPTDWYVLALVYAQTQDADNAIDAYNHAIVLAGDDFAVQKSYGLYLTELNQRERAVPVLRKAYQLDPTDTQITAALRKFGIVPGPSLLQEEQMAKPVMPRGPLPEVELNIRDRSSSAR